MTNPNILALTTSTLNQIAVEATTTSPTQILTNASSSGIAYQINCLQICNTDSASHTVIVNLYSAAALGGSATPIVSGTTIPANTTLNVVTSQTPQVVTENTSIGFTASSANVLYATGTYFQMS